MPDAREDRRVQLSQAANLVTRDVLDETLVVPIRAGAADLTAIYVLNPTGACLWRHLDGVRTIGDLVDLLWERFEVDRATARKDVEDFLASLETAGLTQDPVTPGEGT